MLSFRILELCLSVCLFGTINAGLTAGPRATESIFSDIEKLEPRSYTRRQTVDVIETCKIKGTFALTYDDGPYIYENQISDYLSSHNAKGTFFINGMNYGCIYEQKYVESLRRAFSQGHAIGSHTWSHANITELSEEQLIRELSLLEVAFKKILGIRTKIFRPPYGEINERAKKVLHDRGYSIITWTLDSGDSIGASPEDSISMYRDNARKYSLPQIALNHETRDTTASKVTPKAIEILKKAGYKLVTVPECLGLPNYYERVGKPQARDSSWTCDS